MKKNSWWLCDIDNKAENENENLVVNDDFHLTCKFRGSLHDECN